MAKINKIKGNIREYIWFGLFGFIIINVTASNLFAADEGIDISQLKMGWILYGFYWGHF